MLPGTGHTEHVWDIGIVREDVIPVAFLKTTRIHGLDAAFHTIDADLGWAEEYDWSKTFMCNMNRPQLPSRPSDIGYPPRCDPGKWMGSWDSRQWREEDGIDKVCPQCMGNGQQCGNGDDRDGHFGSRKAVEKSGRREGNPYLPLFIC